MNELISGKVCLSPCLLLLGVRRPLEHVHRGPEGPLDPEHWGSYGPPRHRLRGLAAAIGGQFAWCRTPSSNTGWVPGRFVGTGQGEYLHTLRHVSISCVLAIVTSQSVVALRCVEGKFFFSILVVGMILVSISISIFEMSLTYNK
jgi:hypothetical protein